MIEFLFFLTGVIFPSVVAAIFFRRNQKKYSSLSDAKVRLEQEKEIVVEFMHNLAVAIGEGVARKNLYQRIAHTAVLTTGAMSACIYEKNSNGRLQGVAVVGLFPPQRALKTQFEHLSENSPRARFLEKVLHSEILEEGEGMVGQVSKTGKPIFIEKAQDDPRLVRHKDPSLLVRSIIFSPLVHNDKTIGVLVVANPTNGLSFTETDFSLVNSLAEQAALAIRNSDALNLRIEKSRMDADLQLASEVQELFLAQEFPDCKGLQVNAHYVPSSQVGGDFYDFKKLSPNKYAVSIADVSGKGVPASLLMALCQTNLRHFLFKSRKPSEVLKLLNKELEERIREDMFITLFLGIIDTHNNTLTFARAGHEPALLGKSKSSDPILETSKLDGSGMALGMVPQKIFEEVIEDHSVQYEPGDMLVLYTDGITETENEERKEFGITRLTECLENSKECSAMAFNKKIIKKLNSFSSTDFERDDLTILTVKRV